jgi:ACR3 family arsenite transporter
MTSDDPEFENLIEGANKDIGFFERYLTLWVALCIGAGIALALPNVLGEMTYAEVNLPVAVLI